MLSDIIAAFLPRGFFPPVVPGTKFVTVGGMIAADVHGKNHHGAGGFGDHVESFELALPNGDVRTCSPKRERRSLRRDDRRHGADRDDPERHVQAVAGRDRLGQAGNLRCAQSRRSHRRSERARRRSLFGGLDRLPRERRFARPLADLPRPPRLEVRRRSARRWRQGRRGRQARPEPQRPGRFAGLYPQSLERRGFQ